MKRSGLVVGSLWVTPQRVASHGCMSSVTCEWERGVYPGRGHVGTMTVCCPRLLPVSRCMCVWSVREAQWLGSGITVGHATACGQSWVYVLCDLWVGEGVCPCGHHDGVLSPTAVRFPMHACMECA